MEWPYNGRDTSHPDNHPHIERWHRNVLKDYERATKKKSG